MNVTATPGQFKGLTLAALLATTTACTTFEHPDNIEPAQTGGAYQAQYRTPEVARQDAAYLHSAEMNRAACLPHRNGAWGKGSGLVAHVLRGELLSRNDLVDIRVADDEVFNGSYVVTRDGMLKLPFLPPIRAQGRSTAQIEADLADALLRDGFYDTAPRLSVRVQDFASVSVGVSGAVFEPHAIEIGGQPGDQIDALRQGALGASTEARNLSAALRAAGGIRPDADISAVELRRAGRVYKLDLRGVFEGVQPIDIMLLTGDDIYVPSRQCFQDDLMRPSPISPVGISLFLSNLTQPATGNAPSAIGRDVRAVPYGTRFMQAVVDLNCVGGPRASSAHRSALLYSRNPVSGVSVVIERDIEDMLRRKDRDDFDPYLLPGDSLACYDSTVTNIAEIGRVLGIVGAGLLLSN